MDRIVDKTIIIVFCMATLLLVPYSTEILVGMLLALVVSALCEAMLLPEPLRDNLAIVYLIGALIFPGFAVFVPLVTYDCRRMKFLIARFSWCVPLISALGDLPAAALLFSGILASAAWGLSWRADRIEAEREENLRLRDELRELSISLEQKNRDLQEKQDYEVKLAMLDERGRIAREIHDNVGHLLTRSVLQIEALQVVHADDLRIKEELSQVGATIHEAFDTVRDSVHDLHDDSFDLPTQLFATAKQTSALEVNLDYQAKTIPLTTGYCFLAIVREALANATKHSDATSVKISVTEYPAFWQLVIHDNGSKDPFQATGSSFLRGRFGGNDQNIDARDSGSTGIGLRTMEERTRSIGGVFRMDYDKGFRIFVSVPHADRPAAPIARKRPGRTSADPSDINVAALDGAN